MSLASVFALAAFVVSVAALVAAFASWAFARPRRGATVHIVHHHIIHTGR